MKVESHQQTIPRLELSAAVVSIRISDMLRNELEIQDLKEFFWTDSTIVLGYTNNDFIQRIK